MNRYGNGHYCSCRTWTRRGKVKDEDRVVSSLEFVLFDLAGTIVKDRVGGVPQVPAAIVESFAEAGYMLGLEDVTPHRGKMKIEMIRCLLVEQKMAGVRNFEEEALRIHGLFLNRIMAGVDRLNEVEGATATFRFLKDRRIKVGVGSGFPGEIVEKIIYRMGWAEEALLDYTAGVDQIGAGRPDPGMILHAMKKLGVRDPRRVLKVGDTAADVEEGKNAGTWTAAVLTGSQPEEMLRAAGPDLVLTSVAALPKLFG